MKAELIKYDKTGLYDGSVIEVVVWKLPKPTLERPHGYKYRLNYSLSDGITAVRFDNKLGKGDHKHIGNTEHPYEFKNVEQLLIDFKKEMQKYGADI